MSTESRVIEITEQQEPVIRKLINSGRFNSAGDIFDAALRRETAMDELGQALDKGLDSGDPIAVESRESLLADLKKGKYRK